MLTQRTPRIYIHTVFIDNFTSFNDTVTVSINLNTKAFLLGPPHTTPTRLSSTSVRIKIHFKHPLFENLFESSFQAAITPALVFQTIANTPLQADEFDAMLDGLLSRFADRFWQMRAVGIYGSAQTGNNNHDAFDGVDTRRIQLCRYLCEQRILRLTQKRWLEKCPRGCTLSTKRGRELKDAKVFLTRR
jgi:hypothetical protein